LNNLKKKLKVNQMRKLIFAINLTLDGCCDHTKGKADEELHDYHTALVRNADTFLYGRKTYQLMVPFWHDMAKDPTPKERSMDEFAQAFDAVKQIVVFSQTLDRAEEKNTKIIRGDLRDEVLKLKQEQGKSILTGGVNIPSQLIELDLIDEYHFVVQPLVVGEGTRLLEGVSLLEQLQLKLVETKIFKSGSIALRYLKS
jgi:dihydrofolate reductase